MQTSRDGLTTSQRAVNAYGDMCKLGVSKQSAADSWGCSPRLVGYCVYIAIRQPLMVEQLAEGCKVTVDGVSSNRVSSVAKLLGSG
jgi:hypothetical protein